MVRQGILIVTLLIHVLAGAAEERLYGYSGIIYLKDGNFAAINNPKAGKNGLLEADVDGWRKTFSYDEIKRIESCKPAEIAEADLLINKLNYPIALIYFSQYAQRYLGTDWAAYCVERAAYCRIQLNDEDKALKLLKKFLGRKQKPLNYRDHIDHHRCRALLGRIYHNRNDLGKALEQFEQCTHFRTAGEEALNLLRIAELKVLQRGFDGEKLKEIHRKYIMMVLFAPPHTPGRLTILRQLIATSSGLDCVQLENMFKRDYPYCKL